MPRYIDADELILKCKAIISDKWNEQAAPASWANAYADFIDDIENEPTANVEPVRHGRWIATNDGNKKRCSECGIIHLIAQYPCGKANYCPNCGAKMDGDAK